MRPKVAGDLSTNQMLYRDGIHDRTVSGFLTGVDSQNGIAKITLNGVTSSGRVATLPVLWASFPASGQGTWGRFIPFDNSTVKVSFDYDATPHIVGYDIVAPSPSYDDANGNPQVGDVKAGWSQLVVAQANGDQPYWTTLEQGEYDFMSVGGAYIRGFASGRLLMQAGQTSASLNKAETRNYETTLLKSIQSQDSQFRFGEIRRYSSQGNPETQLPAAPAPSGKEFYMELYAPPTGPGIPGIAIGRFGFATAITEPGFGASSTTNFTGAFGNPDIFYMEVDMPNTGTTMWAHEVDQMGNVSWHSSMGTQIQWLFDQATTVNMNSPQAAFSSTAQSVSRTSSTSITEMCDTMSVTASTSYSMTTQDWTVDAAMAALVGTMTAIGSAPVGGIMNGTLLFTMVETLTTTFVAGITPIAPIGAIPIIGNLIWVPAFTALLITYVEGVAAAMAPGVSTSITCTVSL